MTSSFPIRILEIIFKKREVANTTRNNFQMDDKQRKHSLKKTHMLNEDCDSHDNDNDNDNADDYDGDMIIVMMIMKRMGK